MVAAVLLLTLWPLPEQAYRSSLSPVTCLVCGDQGVQDVIQNIIMLLPLGLALGLAGVRPGRVALGAFGLAVLVETLQYTVVTGRDASLSDVLTNTAGAALGAAIAPHLPALLRPGRRAAAILAVLATVFWASAWLFGAWALQGDIGAGNWRGRFPGDLPDAPALNGEAIRASISDAPFGLVPVTLPATVEQGFARDSFTLRVEARPGPPIAWRENVVTLIDFRDDGGDANNHLVMTLNRVRTRALLTFRINAARARLRVPSFNLGPAFDAPPGGDVSLQVSRLRGTLRADVQRGGQALVTEYRIGPELLWSVMAPRTPWPGLPWMVEAFLWAAGLLGVGGYWAGRARSVGIYVFVVAAAVSVQLLTPHVFAVAPQSLLGWTMLLGGLTVGAVLGHRTASHFPLPSSRS